MYKKTQPKKTHRIRPLRFLNPREKHRPDCPSLLSIEENVGPTGFSSDRILCGGSEKQSASYRLPPLQMELACRVHLGGRSGAGGLTQYRTFTRTGLDF